MYEVEVKAVLKDREKTKEKLEALDVVFSEELHQIDEIFTLKDYDFPPPKGTPVLRIREQNNKYIFTLKINQSSRQDCIEKEVEIIHPKEWREIFVFMGYQKNAEVNKKRIKTEYEGMEIVLDNVEDLGEFIEAEKIVTTENPEDRQNTQEELFVFLETLGVKKEDRVIDGKYDIMLYEKLKNK